MTHEVDADIHSLPNGIPTPIASSMFWLREQRRPPRAEELLRTLGIGESWRSVVEELNIGQCSAGSDFVVAALMLFVFASTRKEP